MANQIIRPDDLPPRANPVASEVVPSDNGVTVAGVTWEDGVNAGRPLASQSEAEAGVQATKAMTPLTTKQAIDAQVPAIVGGAIAGLGLGTAAQADVGDFATAAQGLLADSAIQSVVAGVNVTVDISDPKNPVVNSVGGVAPGDKDDVVVVDPSSQWIISDAAKGRLVAFASNRVALASLNGDTYQAVDLLEAGRKGLFLWVGSDLSSEVAFDTQQGIYVAPTSDPTGTTGAWVRQFDGNVHASWFGGHLQAAMTVSDFLEKQLYLGEKGDSYTINSGLTVPDGLTVFSNLFGGTGAKIIASNGNYRALTLGQGAKLIGIEIEGPGNDAYNISSQGIYQIGSRNFPSAPNYALGPTIENCHIHGFRNAGIWLEYVTDFLIKDTRVDDVGYMGIAGLSVKNGNVLRCLVDGISPGTSSNAYGIVMTRNSSDEIADPSSQDVTIENCEVRNNEIWHGFDTHSGIGIRFINCVTRNCRKGVFITASTNASAVEVLGPKRCEVKNFQYLDPNSDRTKRAVAVYIGGAVSDPAEDCRASNVYAFGAGTDRPAGDRGGAIILNRTRRSRIDGVTLIEPLSWGLQLDYDNKDYSITGLTVVDVNSDHYSNTAAILVLRSGNTGRILDYKLIKDKDNQASYRNNIGIQTAAGLTSFALTLGSGRNDMTTKTDYQTALTAYDN